MKTRLIPFSVSTASRLSIEHFFTKLAETRTDEQFEEAGRFYFLDTESDAKYYIGLVVTVKSQRKFCELRKNRNNFKVVVNNLQNESNLMDFNFFIINKNNGIGLYQHYFQSCSIGQAGSHFRKEFVAMRKAAREEYASELVEAGQSESKAEKTAGSEYKGALNWNVLVRNEDLPAILQELSEIKSFQVQLDYLQPIEDEFEPLTGKVKSQSRKYSFVNDESKESLIGAITAVARNRQVKDGRVYGKEGDQDRIIKITNQPCNFGEYEFDDIAAHLNDLDVENYVGSWVVRELKNICEQNPHFFDVEREDQE